MRPCPFVECRYHLHRRDKGTHAPEHVPIETCALDVADEGPHTLEEVARLLGVVRERVRQVEASAIYRLRVIAAETEEEVPHALKEAIKAGEEKIAARKTAASQWRGRRKRAAKQTRRPGGDRGGDT